MIIPWLAPLLACGHAPAPRPDVEDTQAPADSGCPNGSGADVWSASAAEGQLSGWDFSWSGVGFAGDLSGDGDREIVAWGTTYGDTTQEVVRLYEASSFASSPSGEAAWTMSVPDPGAENSYLVSVGAEGDLTGDGATDLVLGATTDELIVTSGPLESAPLSSDAFLQVTGDGLGRSQALAGDLDGDGVPDLAAGMFSAVVLISPVVLAGELDVADAGPRLSFRGERSGFVPEVAAGGDQDGDGLADLLVSTWSWSGVFLGPIPSGVEDSAEATFDGDGARGRRTGASGDFDGDGYPDIVVGAPESDHGSSLGGSAWVVRGPVHGSVDLANAEAHIPGDGDLLNLGSAVASAGDADGDGADELLVSADAADCRGNSATSCVSRPARVYRFHGPVSGTLEPSCADVTWDGENYTGDRFGKTVYAARDIDGSGRPDMVVSTEELSAYLFIDP